MFEFRVLGGLDLRDDAGTKMSAVLVHPKRSAVLVYLALARPRGFHRRDSLLALFWPESSQEHARASLRKTVHNIRRALGDDVLVGSGDEELALNEQLVWCDAVALEREIDAQNVPAALELYRGPLLTGFFLSESPEFERWLEQERARLRDRAFEAAWRQADVAANTASSIDAAVWGRRAAALAPDDEGALRRLLALLDRVGDRAGALGAYEDFARHLQRDYDAEPAAETQALMREIRSRVVANGHTPVAATAVLSPPEVIAQPTSPRAAIVPDVAKPRVEYTDATRRRWSLRVPILALVVVVVLVGGWRIRHRARARETPVPAANTIAVLPFSFRGAQEFSYLREGMASLLGTSLDGMGGFTTVDPSTLLTVASPNPSATMEPAQAREVASRVGAGSFIVGDIVEAAGRLHVSAALYGAGESPTLLARASDEDTSSQIFALVDRLVGQLVTRQRGDTGQRLTKLAAVTTSSLPALKAYLEGEQRFRIGHYKEAVDAFQRAVSADSSFALAYYRLALAYSWSSDTMLRPMALRATQLAQRLAPSDRALVEAFVPFANGESDEAERRYRAILSTRPFEGEAWYPLGEVLFHFNPVRGRPIEEARPVFTRAISLGPSDSPLTHLLEIEAIDRNYTLFDSLLKGIAPGAHFDLVGRTVRAFKRGTEADRLRILAEHRATPDADLANHARHMLFLLDDRAGAERVVSLLIDPARPREMQALGHILIAHLEASAGRWHAADSALREATALDQTRALEHRGILEALPFLPIAASARNNLRVALEQWTPDSVTGPAVVFMGDEKLHEPFRSYLLGLTYGALGRDADAENMAGRLERATVDQRSRQMVVAFAHGIRAHVALGRQNANLALRELQQVHDNTSAVALVGVIPFYGYVAERFVHAEALHALGRDEEALSWYGSFGEHSAYSRVFLAPSHRRRAEIYEKLGRHADAAEQYARFIDLWKDCDPELRSDVADAQMRLKRLQVLLRGQ